MSIMLATNILYPRVE